MTLPAVIQSQNNIRTSLIQRDEALLAEAERMDALLANSVENHWWSWGGKNYKAIATLARQRLKALKAGLLPVKIEGKFYGLYQLIHAGVAIPTEIAEQANEARRRIPSGQLRVHGVSGTTEQEIRRRDPVLTLYYGGEEYFLGFWLEIAVPDDDLPQFFGIVAPWAERRGRGRPRKIRS